MPPFEQFVQNLRDNIAPVITKATIPFFVIQKRTVKRAHTGIFLRVGEKHFLLTASHLWKEINSLGLPVLAGWDDDAKRPVQLINTEFHLGDPSTYDVAVATLSAEIATVLRKRFSPIFVRQMRPRDDDEHGIYVLCGCPQETVTLIAEKRIAAPYLTYICQKYTDDRSHDPLDSFKFDPRMHCLFALSRDGMDAVSLNDVTLPATEGIKGISGSGIWKVGRIEGKTLVRYGPDVVELCAIEHRYNQDKGYVVATWVERAVEGIINRHPETRKVFEMYPNSPKW